MSSSERWFLDTEFAENGETIKLISIALVSEGGTEYYATASDGWSESDCDDWVKANVLPHIHAASERKSRATIRDEVRALLLGNGRTPEVWAYFADYDWVALCQLFGRMVDLPSGMPMYCRDLKQSMEERLVSRDMLPAQEREHDALEDARWTRNAYALVVDA